MKSSCAALILLCALAADGQVLKLTATAIPDDQTSAARLRFELDLQNTSPKDIDVLSAMCRLPGWYNASPRQDIILTEFYGDLNAGDVETQVIDEQPLSLRNSIQPLFHDVPLILYKKVPAEITIRYRYVGDVTEQPPVTQSIDLPARAPLWHVLAGSIVGILTLFLILFLAKQQPADPLRALIAAVVAVPVAIIVTNFASQYLALLPLKVDLRDFMGGFVVGLLGVWLTPKIIDALKASIGGKKAQVLSDPSVASVSGSVAPEEQRPRARASDNLTI